MSKPRRLDVMLSSTSKDLPDHRELAEDASSRSGFYVVKMENLTATHNADAISVSMAMVEEAEVYVGIFGMRYGFRPKDDRNPNEISITEMEYRRAKELGMPILVFIMSEDHKGPDTSEMNAKDAKKMMDSFYESDTIGEEKLEIFKKELSSNHIVAFFDSAEDLRTVVLQALKAPSLIEAANKYAEADTTQTPSPPKATIPYPPKIYAYPAYSGQNALFIGRRKETHMLNKWSKPEGKHPMLVLEAIGGMGKSALTWRWVQDRAVPFDGVFWYSFYEGGAEMGDFVRRALAYVTRQTPKSLKDMPFPQMVSQLVHALQNGRFLIVLDGLERVLVAYHRWNAAQMQDDEVEEGDDYRDCTNPRDNDVLRQLVGCDPSRILITSRLMPRALTEGGDPLNGVQHEKLKGLSREDARRLWGERGITWSDEGVLDNFMNQFARHSLLLKLMVEAIKQHKRINGNFDKWNNLYGEEFKLFEDIKAKRHHILQFAYEGLTDEARKLLSQMAALGNAVDIETLNVFNPFLNMPEVLPKPREPYIPSRYSDERKAEKQAEYDERKQEYETYLKAKTEYERSTEYKKAIHQFDALLQDLEERGLIWWDADNMQYDLHPVVRGYAFTQLRDDDRPDTYDTIYNFFEEQERGNSRTEFASFADMQNIIAMYNALIGAGKFDTAANLFWDRFRYSLVTEGLGLYHKAYELLLPLFPDGLNTMPCVTTSRLQSRMLNLMSAVLSYLGRYEDMLVVQTNDVAVVLKADDLPNLRVGISNYALSLASLNRLAQALIAHQLGLELEQLLQDKSQIANGQYYLMKIHIYLGNWREARIAYDNFIQNPPSPFWQIAGQKRYAEGLIQQGADRETIEALLDDCERRNQNVKSTLNMRDLLNSQGELTLREGDNDPAIKHYTEAARIGNEQGLRDPDAWGGLARAYAMSGNLTEALRIIEDGVDDHGFAAAVVYLKNGDLDEAKEKALEFYTWAWAQGEPYVWRWGLEQAQKILAELGVDEPQLPVWDDSMYAPFEHEEEIRARIERLRQEKADEDGED